MDSLQQTDDQLLSSSNRIVYKGFAMILVFMVIFLLINLQQIKQVSEQMHLIVEESTLKSQYAQAMRDAARERVTLLLMALYEQDPFVQDELFMSFDNQAGAFMMARVNLKEMVLTPLEEEALTLSTEDAQQGTEALNKARDMIEGQDMTLDLQHEVAELIAEEVIPARLGVLSAMQEIQESQSEAGKEGLRGAEPFPDLSVIDCSGGGGADWGALGGRSSSETEQPYWCLTAACEREGGRGGASQE